MGFLDAFRLSRLKEGLAKTRENLAGKIHRILAGKTKIDDELIGRLEEALIGGDVGVATATKIIDSLKEKVRKERFESPAELDTLLRGEARRLLAGAPGGETDPFALPLAGGPHVIMIVGVNGVGKTTTIGKLAYNYRKAGRTVLIAAADTFRAAANEQLEIWAKRAGVEIIQQTHGADPAAVSFDALKSAQARGIDLLIIDTAGRLHTKLHLMEELKKIRHVLQKLVPDAPHEVLLVLDASTGQNAIQQAKHFTAAVGVSGLIVSKLDGTARGGVVLAIADELGIPVRYIGVGEQLDDLQPFDPNAFIDALFETSP
ncbi:MAG TPA: signal recognition particle-docking protein FtsY [Bacteroidota bacterium]|jgi:fused signal recognition particle receptor